MLNPVFVSANQIGHNISTTACCRNPHAVSCVRILESKLHRAAQPQYPEVMIPLGHHDHHARTCTPAYKLDIGGMGNVIGCAVLRIP
jgi:hypothetical protein